MRHRIGSGACSAMVMVLVFSLALAKEKDMTPNELARALETSHDKKLLASAAAKLAASPDPADHLVLRKWLPTDSFLYRLNARSDYDGARQQLRLRRPLEALRNNPAPVARETIMTLVRNPGFTSVGSRVELLLEATASVRPAPPDLVAFWDKYSQPDDGFTPITIMAVVDNGSRPALDLFEKKLGDGAHADDEKVSWMRADVLTHRNDVALLESCERILKGALPDPLKSELIDVLFDYRPGEWFRPGLSYSPPAGEPSSAARAVRQRIRDHALEKLQLSERQRALLKAAS
jgi:hypothetical protein